MRPGDVVAGLWRQLPLGALPAGLVVLAGTAWRPPPGLWLVLAGMVAAPAALYLAVVDGHDDEQAET